MQKCHFYLSLFFIFFIYNIQCPYILANTILYPVIISEQEKKPDYYSLKWLYEMKEKDKNFALIKKVQKNILYYKELVKDHIEKLEEKIEDKGIHKNKKIKSSFQFLLNGLIALLFYGGGISTIKLYKKCIIPEEKVLCLSLGCASILLYTYFSIYSFLKFLKVFYYKKCIIARIKRDKKILELLIEAEKKFQSQNCISSTIST